MSRTGVTQVDLQSDNTMFIYVYLLFIWFIYFFYVYLCLYNTMFIYWLKKSSIEFSPLNNPCSKFVRNLPSRTLDEKRLLETRSKSGGARLISWL